MWRIFRGSNNLFRQRTTSSSSRESSSSTSSTWNNGSGVIAAVVLLSCREQELSPFQHCEEGPVPSPPKPTAAHSRIQQRKPATFRQRRMTMEYGQNDNSTYSAEQENDQPVDDGGEGAVEDHANQDKVMYPTKFKSSNLIESPTYPQPLPFSKNTVGSFSIHGLEPRFILPRRRQDNDDCDQDNPPPSSPTIKRSASSQSPSSPPSSSLLMSFFGPSAPVATEQTPTATTAPIPRDPTKRKVSHRVLVLGHKINQDRGQVVHPYGRHERTALFAVYDGHGRKGDLLAEYTMHALNNKLQQHPSYPQPPFTPTDPITEKEKELEEGITKALRETIHAIDQEIKGQKQLQSECSGSTACVALLRDNTLWVANVGDSRAVLGRRRRVEDSVDASLSSQSPSLSSSQSSVSRQASLQAINLTKDQTARDPQERERILKSGGYITIPEDESFSPRVWLDKHCSLVGLAMSRSIGDHALESVGVIGEPAVEKYEVERGDKFMILASDGVWEFISSEEAVRIVERCFDDGLTAHEACRELVRTSMQKWKKMEGDYRDDITAIVVRLDDDVWK